MPSPRWSEAKAPPIAAAIAAATHHAWAAPRARRLIVFQETLRKMVGPELYETVELRALSTFQLQPDPPEGFELPPEWAWFEICPGCQQLRKTKYTRAQNGRVKLEILRDKDWLYEQFEQGIPTTAIAKRLGCTPSLVVDWAAKHKLTPPKTKTAQEFDAEVRRRHLEGEAPGTIARALETPVMHVRQSLERQKIANRKHGQHYHEREWWRVRLEDRRMKLTECCREAGIVNHNGTYYVNKFGLRECTRRNNRLGRPKKYPVLHDRAALQELLSRHSTYETAAAELGCAPTLVSKAARDLLDAPKRAYPNQLPQSRPEWWTERIDRGATTFEIAEEAGIQEKSAREQLRVRGLLDRAYANNYQREKDRRKGRAA